MHTYLAGYVDGCIEVGAAYLILCINRRERALKLSNLLVTAAASTTSQQIIISILNIRRVIIARSELVCIVTQKGLLATQEVIALKTGRALSFCLCCSKQMC